MQKARQIILIAVYLLVLASFAGCSILSPATGDTTVPTQDPAIIQATLDMAKTQAAQTVIADVTLNAPQATNTLPPEPATATQEPTSAPANTEAPTSTVAPTNTLPPPTATRTVVVVTNTPAPTNTPVGYACTLSDALPGFTEDFKPNAPFDAAWTIKNTGSKTWAANEIDIRYLSGTKMHEGPDVTDMPGNVEPDKTFRLVFDMLAPNTTGRHTETWVLSQGGTTLCAMSVTIDVVE